MGGKITLIRHILCSMPFYSFTALDPPVLSSKRVSSPIFCGEALGKLSGVAELIFGPALGTSLFYYGSSTFRIRSAFTAFEQ